MKQTLISLRENGVVLYNHNHIYNHYAKQQKNKMYVHSTNNVSFFNNESKNQPNNIIEQVSYFR